MNAIATGSEPGPLIVKHCSFYDNDGRHGADPGSSGLGDTLFVSNIDADPNFATPAGVPFDYLGQARVLQPDAGAYEFTP